MADKTPQLVAYLGRTDDWVPASELAVHLGVSTRTVRSYVTALRAAYGTLEIISSSPEGYRLDRNAHAEFAAAAHERAGLPAGPQERLTYLIARLTESSVGLDIHDLASTLFVSESTIEGDLRRVRTFAGGAGVELEREGPVVRLHGPEPAQRRLISRMFHEEHAGGLLDLRRVQEAFQVGDLGGFKTDVIDLLRSAGYAVNEFGLDGVLLHTAIAIERSRIHPMDDADATGVPEDLMSGLEQLIERHFRARLATGEVAALAILLTTRVGTRAVGADPEDSEHLDTLRRIVHRAQEEYLIDLDDEAFLLRLALHTANLVTRARAGVSNPNPLTRSIKTGYPLTYELAVFIASEVQREFGIAVGEDEIAYIALHIGSHLETKATPGERIGATLVSPSYHDLAQLLENRILTALGSEVRIEQVITRTDVDPADLDSDLVVTTLPWDVRPPNVIVVQPLPTDGDIEAVRAAVTRIRRQRRRRAIAEELTLYFSEDLFFRDLPATDAESAIRGLGQPMITAGIIDDEYLAGALERERLSPTSFTESLAVPHSMSMTARRTAIALTLNETPVPWGDGAVNVIALTAFSAAGRASFQTVFEQFVEVFSDRATVQRFLTVAVDFPSFIDELVRVIDE